MTGPDAGAQPGYAIAVTVDRPFAQVLSATRDALAAEGFGVLTEIDMQATLKAKIGADIAPQVILGACRPPLAHAALLAEPSIGLLLPCNVVVRSVAGDRTRVETIDPAIMVSVTDNPDLQAVATEARARLTSALGSLTQSPPTP
ncbi:DUF302 domain-containing protein [Nakamurella multipartita]|uniref:DUF302 domain-containing protein n=1 Tax=Nakamurella multipartita (strain ATCC 700099 / DSM 44233 / CIP 104796 / JCM 9543 / NBRC 105858 / Y-104) TaxID=479431 RepID=C8X7H6_NAKMY|nr:DUF302 domain-containing protein [Nakamurella multipartita]ACV78929.1 protein of unknown function DUF302 [Nakamurella multipartita DSM 44233]